MKKIIVTMMILVTGLGNYTNDKVKIIITGSVVSTGDNLPLPQVSVIEKGTRNGVATDVNGNFKIEVNEKAVLIFRFLGYATQEVVIGDKLKIDVKMVEDVGDLGEVVVTRRGRKKDKWTLGYAIAESQMVNPSLLSEDNALSGVIGGKHAYIRIDKRSSESYKDIEENTFKSPWKNPYSTFSIDVDAASYSNVRRFINQGQLPPKDAVKIEEMINYFNYDYEGPKGKDPFAVQHEVSVAPWNSKHQLVHIGLQGEKIATENLPASNLVFLLDVSGSMGSHNKLPLLKTAFKMLTRQLRKEDKVAMVVYAGAAGVVLPSTSGADIQTIQNALENLQAGGSTAGGAGIQLAYKIAKKNYIEGGNNRIILATDGDFNVGASSDKAMEDLIEEKRKEGVFLTVLGFGMGNYKDSKMEILADKGNGNHAYIDNILEAKKVLVNEFGGTLFTIAKDVKLQVEFNPATVQAYRLIGYENRKLADEDFNNDKKDAGELGSGHSVTALYEIIPVGVESSFKPLDDLKYQDKGEKRSVNNTEDLVTVKLRYKQPDGKKSTLLQEVISKKGVRLERTSNNFQWSAAVASFGMLLRDSDYLNGMGYGKIIAMAKAAKGSDFEGYRAEFIKLVEAAELLTLDK